MDQSTRRDFLKSTVAATVLSGIGGASAAPATKRSATNWVALGKSNVKVTRLAFGTGTFSGRVQRDLGQDEFTGSCGTLTTLRRSRSAGVRRNRNAGRACRLSTLRIRCWIASAHRA